MNLSSKNFLRRTATVNVEVEAGPAGPAGVSFNWRGAWSSDPAATYQVNDVVSYNGSSYIALVAHGNPLAVPDATPAFWELMAANGADGADGADGTDGANFVIAGTWNPVSVTYSIYDVVEFNGSSYLCAANHTSSPGTLPTAGLPWQLLAAKGETGETGEVGADGPQGVDGVSIVWRGPWADATGYAPNNAVEHNGSSYICTDAHNSTPGTEPGVGMDWETVWDLMAAAGV